MNLRALFITLALTGCVAEKADNDLIDNGLKSRSALSLSSDDRDYIKSVAVSGVDPITSTIPCMLYDSNRKPRIGIGGYHLISTENNYKPYKKFYKDLEFDDAKEIILYFRNKGDSYTKTQKTLDLRCLESVKTYVDLHEKYMRDIISGKKKSNAFSAIQAEKEIRSASKFRRELPAINSLVIDIYEIVTDTNTPSNTKLANNKNYFKPSIVAEERLEKALETSVIRSCGWECRKPSI